MKLQPVPIEDIPIGIPLPWRLYDRKGYIVFVRGEMVVSRLQLEKLLAAGLLRDVDAPVQTHEAGDWVEFNDVTPSTAFPPDGIKPQVGERVQIRLVNRSLQVYYTVHLLGYIKNLSVMVTTPMVAGNPLILMDGEVVEVRMLNGSNIYAFHASILRLCISPAHYMHLESPAEVRVQKLRKFPWASVNLSVTVSNAQGALVLARIVNLSSDGAQLLSTNTLGEPGNALKLSLLVAMDELKTTLNLEAVILHIQPASSGMGGEDAMLEYGVTFSNVNEADALWLKGLVYRHIAEGHLA